MHHCCVVPWSRPRGNRNIQRNVVAVNRSMAAGGIPWAELLSATESSAGSASSSHPGLPLQPIGCRVHIGATTVVSACRSDELSMKGLPIHAERTFPLSVDCMNELCDVARSVVGLGCREKSRAASSRCNSWCTRLDSRLGVDLSVLQLIQLQLRLSLRHVSGEASSSLSQV